MDTMKNNYMNFMTVHTVHAVFLEGEGVKEASEMNVLTTVFSPGTVGHHVDSLL